LLLQQLKKTTQIKQYAKIRPNMVTLQPSLREKVLKNKRQVACHNKSAQEAVWPDSAKFRLWVIVYFWAV
jgi:hypothetical protein